MEGTKPDGKVCPYCKSDNIGIGYQLGNARIFADEYAVSASRDCSEVEYLICKNCGSILRAKVLKPEVFHPADTVRRDQLLDFIERHGILLCNENPDLPSLSGLGYEEENLIQLVDLHEVFYCMIYKKRSTFLSRKAYDLLKRCKVFPPMDADSKKVYDALRSAGKAEKDVLKASLDMDKKVFERSFRFLLENLYITAFARGRRLNPNWYTYLYSTAETWEKEAGGLYFSGNVRAALEDLLCTAGGVSEKEFRKMVG